MVKVRVYAQENVTPCIMGKCKVLPELNSALLHEDVSGSGVMAPCTEWK
jgi:hypothetical protein